MTTTPTQWTPTTPPPAGEPTNGRATAGFVLGLIGLFLGWVPVLGLAVTIPAIALSRAGRRLFRSGRVADPGLSTAGTVLGWLGTAFCALTTVLMIVGAANAPAQPVGTQQAAAPAAAAPVLLTVPNVVGMTDAQARDVLRAAGFTTVVLGPPTAPTAGVAAGTVTTQRPGPTGNAAAGDPIVLGEAAAPPPPAPVVVPQSAPTTQPTAAPASPVVVDPDVDVDRPRTVAPRPLAVHPSGGSHGSGNAGGSGSSGGSSGNAGGGSGGGATYANCSAARAAGVTPLYRGDPGYAPKLDRDNDGIACE